MFSTLSLISNCKCKRNHSENDNQWWSQLHDKIRSYYFKTHWHTLTFFYFVISPPVLPSLNSPLAVEPDSRPQHCQSWFWHSSSGRCRWLNSGSQSCCWLLLWGRSRLWWCWCSDSTSQQTGWRPWCWRSTRRWGRPTARSWWRGWPRAARSPQPGEVEAHRQTQPSPAGQTEVSACQNREAIWF